MTRVVAIADSDSYLKWAAGLLGELEGAETTLLLVRTPLTPSPRQQVAALAGTAWQQAPVLPLRTLLRQLRRDRPDAVVLACTGPVVQVIGEALARTSNRPVMVTGLPGLSVPATQRAWEHRLRADVFVVHSHREREEFHALGAQLGATGRVGLARLPFLAPAQSTPGTRAEVVFAAQAKVPAPGDQRRALLLALHALAVSKPDLGVVVKLRATGAEQQTHAEEHRYDVLWDELVAQGLVRRDALRFSAEPMSSHLTSARALVTVSSTAALEALAADVPVLVLDEWGVDASMLNLAFGGSGLLGGLADLTAGRAFRPDPGWAQRHGLHPQRDCDWQEALGEALALRSREGLPDRPPGSRPVLLARAKLALPARLVPLARSAGRARAWLRGTTGVVDAPAARDEPRERQQR